MVSIFDQGLEPTDANHATLKPLDFLVLTASVYSEYPAVIYGETRSN
jgi:3-(methylthio)propionyl---CoA ligase